MAAINIFTDYIENHEGILTDIYQHILGPVEPLPKSHVFGKYDLIKIIKKDASRKESIIIRK